MQKKNIRIDLHRRRETEKEKTILNRRNGRYPKILFKIFYK